MAWYRDVPSDERIMQFKFRFLPERNVHLERNVSLDEPSKATVRRTLSSLLREDVPLTVRTFVQAVDRISKLNLYLCEVEIHDPALYDWPASQVDFDFYVSQSPRCLHEEESGTLWDLKFNSVDYRRTIVDTFMELPDDEVDE